MSDYGPDDENTTEHFWGCELTSENPTGEWTMKDEDGEEEDDDFLIHTLYLRLATLGKGSVQSEQNIVEIETMNFVGEIVKQPLLTLVGGVLPTVSMDLSFGSKNKVVFTLIEGSGPVYLSGQHMVEMPDDDADQTQDSMYTEDSEDDLTEEDEKNRGKGKGKGKGQKRRTSGGANKGSKAKRSKLDEESASDEDDSEEDSEDEDDMEGSAKKTGKAGGKKGDKKGAAKAGKKAKKVGAKK